jgi:hypothetical protein
MHVYGEAVVANPYQSNGNGNNGPQDVDHRRHLARAPHTDSQKLERVEAPSSALAIGLNAFGDFMSFVVESRKAA